MSSSNISVYTGVWKNWSEGPIVGATLTLSARNGVILVAVLALFIQLAGVHSWSIISFITHQLKATRESRDGLYHQQQATLRNSSSDISTLWRFTQIGLAWHPLKRKSFRRSVGIMLLALVHLVSFTAAGILSSHFTKRGNDVLIARSPSCGIWDGPDNNNADNWETLFAADVAYDVYMKNMAQSSRQYVQNCLSQSQALPECDMFKRSQLNWTTRNTTCPFTGGLCLGSSNGSIQLDTGLIDSRNDLGINSQDDARVQYRRVTTCVPIVNDERYVRIENTTVDNTTYLLAAAFYGPNSAGPATQNIYSDLSLENATYITSHFQPFETPYDDSTMSPYVINVEVSYPNTTATSFSAIPQLYRPDANVILIFASSYDAYTNFSDDLWLPAHTGMEIYSVTTNGTLIRTPEYILDNALNTLACMEQHQFCNPSRRSSSDNCTPLDSINTFSDSNASFNAIFDSDYQKTIAWIIQIGAVTASTDGTVQYLDYELLASNLAQGMTSLSLASNQWIQEVKNWFAISMNNLQRAVVATATGPGGANDVYTDGQANGNPSLQQFCENQIIQRSDFMNFSVLAISLIFGLGGLLIVLSWCVESIVGWARQKWFRRGLYRQVRWQLDSTLQLQKMAFEEAGLGAWKKGMTDVPVTEMGEEFAREMEWEDLYVSEALRSKREKFLSPLEDVDIVTGDFVSVSFRDEEGGGIELTPVMRSERSSGEGDEVEFTPVTQNSASRLLDTEVRRGR